MIDSHCHLTDPRLRPQLEDVLARAKAAGVERIITIGTTPADWDAVFDVVRERENIRCAIGVHPNHCHEVDPAELLRLRELQAHPSIVALGEMGLDYHHNFADRRRQQTFFQTQMQLAVELSRPVVIHCREAVDDTLAIMSAFPTVAAVFHCYTGTVAEADRILDRGYLLGFTGVVTFKHSEDLREVARRAPDDRILVETDAPYLSPAPMRKVKVNEPSFVVHTAGAVAQTRGTSLQQLDSVTSQNARRFFKWED